MKYLMCVSILLLFISNCFAWSQDEQFPGMFYLNCSSEVHCKYIADTSYSEPLSQFNGVILEYRDGDTNVFGSTDSESRTISNALFVTATGTDSNGKFVDSGKDLCGVMSTVIAKTSTWDVRGVCAFGGSALQLGSGVATNEFFAIQPSYASSKALQLAGVIAIVSPNYNDCGDNPYDAIAAGNNGTKQAQNCIKGFGNFNVGVNLRDVKVAKCGIKMSNTVEGSIIEYLPGTYTRFINSFSFVINNVEVGNITDNPTEDTDIVTIGYLKKIGLINTNSKIESAVELPDVPEIPNFLIYEWSFI